jgi:AcrR family transcriptional regulator
MPPVAERWTQERRREHTRNLLLDAAEEVFAAKGFEGASLDEIAETAGYTRGAIYKHFAQKEELFLEVNRRHNEQILTGFLDLMDTSVRPQDLELGQIAQLWRQLQSRNRAFHVFGTEFSLYVMRNPDVQARVAEQRRSIAEMIARFMDEQAALFGVVLRIPAVTLARIVLACGDGLEIASHIDADQEDLYEPFLELLMSAWEPAPDAGGRAG